MAPDGAVPAQRRARGPPAWSELDWVGRRLREPATGLTLTVISKTVRCRGVSVDPQDYAGQGSALEVLDIPGLPASHLPPRWWMSQARLELGRERTAAIARDT